MAMENFEIIKDIENGSFGVVFLVKRKSILSDQILDMISKKDIYYYVNYHFQTNLNFFSLNYLHFEY